MFGNVPLKWKLVGVSGLLLALLALDAVQAGKPVAFAVLGVGLVIGGGVSALMFARLGDGTAKVIARMDAVDEAAKEHLMRGLQALADGDLTVELHAGTAALADFAGDELGTIQRHTELFRDAMVGCYDAYNGPQRGCASWSGTMGTTAEAVGAASQEMSSTSEEAGKANGEIAQAIGDIAQGAERQARMAEEAQRSAQEIAHAVGESAESAERTAEVAHDAQEAAKAGVDAAEKANDAMRSVRESSESVTEAIRELASKSEQIGMIVQTITGIAEQTNLLALNAAIEAARAGEQGRGFAVVAEEVRKLAEDSQHAAHEISDLIGAMQQETAKAVHVVEEGAKRTQEGAAVVEQTREAFLTIGQAVEDMNARIEQIAAAAEQITASATVMERTSARSHPSPSSHRPRPRKSRPRRSKAPPRRNRSQPPPQGSPATPRRSTSSSTSSSSYPDELPRSGIVAPLAAGSREASTNPSNVPATRTDPMAQDAQTQQLVMFRLGTEPYALAIDHLHEIICSTEPRSVASGDS